MEKTLLIALPVVVVFLLSTNQQDSGKTVRLLYSIIYIQICDEKRINTAGITTYDISDHLAVFINFKLHHPTQQKIKPKFRCMKHFDPNTF